MVDSFCVGLLMNGAFQCKLSELLLVGVGLYSLTGLQVAHKLQIKEKIKLRNNTIIYWLQKYCIPSLERANFKSFFIADFFILVKIKIFYTSIVLFYYLLNFSKPKE